MLFLCPHCPWYRGSQDRLIQLRPDSTPHAYPPRSPRRLPVRSLNHKHQDHHRRGKNADHGTHPHLLKPRTLAIEFLCVLKLAACWALTPTAAFTFWKHLRSFAKREASASAYRRTCSTKSRGAPKAPRQKRPCAAGALPAPVQRQAGYGAARIWEIRGSRSRVLQPTPPPPAPRPHLNCWPSSEHCGCCWDDEGAPSVEGRDWLQPASPSVAPAKREAGGEERTLAWPVPAHLGQVTSARVGAVPLISIPLEPCCACGPYPFHPTLAGPLPRAGFHSTHSRPTPLTQPPYPRQLLWPPSRDQIPGLILSARDAGGASMGSLMLPGTPHTYTIPARKPRPPAPWTARYLKGWGGDGEPVANLTGWPSDWSAPETKLNQRLLPAQPEP